MLITLPSKNLAVAKYRLYQPMGLALAMATAACAGESTPPPEYPAMEAAPGAEEAAPATPEPEASATQGQKPEPATPPPPPVQVVAAERTPIEGAVPSLRIRSPHNGQLIKKNKVELVLDVKNWLLTPDGKHIHVILDNEPYIAVRDTSKPIDLGALVQKSLGHELTEGTHVLRAFPGRGHHESVKDPGAFGVVVFSYKKKTPDFKFDEKAPLLTYSRPKGCVDLGARVLLDFFVSNTKLGPTDSRVHYAVDDVTGDITDWTPFYIENLPAGEHHIQLVLQDAKGAPIPGAFNDTARTFRVAADCKAAAAAAPSSAEPGAAGAPAATPQPPAAVPEAAAPEPSNNAGEKGSAAQPAAPAPASAPKQPKQK